MNPNNNLVEYTSLDDSVIDISPQRVNCKVCRENNLDHKAQLTKAILIILVGVVTIVAIILLEQGVLLKDYFRDTQLIATNTSLNDSSSLPSSVSTNYTSVLNL